MKSQKHVDLAAAGPAASNTVPSEKLPTYVWVPCAAALAVLFVHIVAAVVNKNLWIAFGGQVLGLATFLLMRLAFPRPDEE